MNLVRGLKLFFRDNQDFLQGSIFDKKVRLFRLRKIVDFFRIFFSFREHDLLFFDQKIL